MRSNVERIGYGLFIAVAVLPTAISLLYAFGYSIGLAGLLNEGFTLEYWGRLWEGGEIAASFGVSLAIAAAATIASVAAAIPLALYLRRHLNRGVLSYTIYLPLALPATVAAFIVFQLLSGAGYLSRVLAAFGIISDPTGAPDLVHDRFGIGIIVAQMMIAVPFFMIFLARIYDDRGLRELERTAGTLGAGRRAMLTRVTLPILLRAAFPTILLHLVGVFGAYEAPLLLGAQSPQMVSVLIMRKYAMFDLGRKPEAFICAILYTIVSLSLIVAAYKGMGEREDEG